MQLMTEVFKILTVKIMKPAVTSESGNQTGANGDNDNPSAFVPVSVAATGVFSCVDVASCHRSLLFDLLLGFR